MRALECVFAVALCASVLAPCRRAHAQAIKHELGSTLEVAAGFDSNPTLSLNPNARRDAAVAADGPAPGAVLNALGAAYGVFGRQRWVGAALNTDARAYQSADARHDTALSVFAGTEVGVAKLSLAALLGRYDATFGVDDAWYSSVSPAVQLRLDPAWSLHADAHAGVRRYSTGSQVNWDVGGAVAIQLEQRLWRAALGVDLDQRQSSDPAATRTQVTPFASVRFAVAAWTVALRYTAFARWFAADLQDGVEHTAELSARYRLGDVVSLSARTGFGLARGQTDALAYDRFYALIGVSFVFESGATGKIDAPSRQQQGEAQLTTRDTTRFSLCRPDAREVSVVGTFNGWSEEAGRMQRTDNGCFSVELSIAPGHHRYQWSIDGVTFRPDDAPAYAPDAFGGEDAVLIVPE